MVPRIIFEELGDRLDGVFRRLKIRSVLTQPMLREALWELRRALLESDVNSTVVKKFFQAIKQFQEMRKMMKRMGRLAPRLAGGGGLGSMLR